ncbi:hypothetical protein [Persicobacter diffluens]|uniref:Uncharacterized protein n=1 Tax=Persicobacter diffluens TaxID=981 RepID=A0AAN4W4X9_9BACT|nr:hypothetical protein PEDI_52650 [Persicobacter diffluens]
MTLKNTFIFSLLLLLFSCSENLDIAENDYFLRLLGYNGQDQAVAIKTLSDDGILVAGNLNLVDTNRALFWSKLNKYGIEEWHHNWKEEDNQKMTDWLLKENQILATGMVEQMGISQLAIWKMDLSSGKIIDYNLPLASSQECSGQKLLNTTDGGLIIAGNFTDYSQTVRYEGMIFQRQNAAGEVVWETQNHQLEPFEQLIEAAEINDQFYFFGNVENKGEKYLRIAAINGLGQVVYTKIFGNPGENIEAVSAEITENSVKFLATVGIGSNRRMVFREISLKAELINTKDLANNGIEFAADVCQDAQGNYFILGNRVIDARQTDCLLQKRDANMNLIWEQTYGSEWQDEANKLFLRSSGPGFLATVNFDNKNENANRKMAIYSLDQEGNLK